MGSAPVLDPDGAGWRSGVSLRNGAGVSLRNGVGVSLRNGVSPAQPAGVVERFALRTYTQRPGTGWRCV